MIPIFRHPLTQKALLRELRSWVGTPYRHRIKVKKKGVDCALLMGAIFECFGILTKLEYPEYPRNWFLIPGNELLLQTLEKHLNEHLHEEVTYKEITRREIYYFLTGDVLCFSVSGKVKIDHIGIYYTKGQFVHAVTDKAVRFSFLKGKWLDKLQKVYRFYWRN